MKKVFVVENTVVGVAVGGGSGVSISGPIGSTEYEVPFDVIVDVGWKVDINNGAPIFSVQ